MDSASTHDDVEPMDEKRHSSSTISGTGSLSRRATLALFGIGGIGLASRSVTASSSRRSWEGDVDAEGHALSDLGAVAMRDNPTEIRDFGGDGLRIDNGKLHASGTADLSASLTEEGPGGKYGQLTIKDIQHTLQVRGTRTQSWMMRPFRTPVETNSTSYTKVGDEIGYGLIPFPPGYAPILRVVGYFTNHQDQNTHLRVSTSNNVGDDEATDADGQQTVLELVGEGQTRVSDEVNLAELDDIVYGKDLQERRRPNQFFFEMKTENALHTATIESSSTIALELESL